MEDMATQERSSFMGKLKGIFTQSEEEEAIEATSHPVHNSAIVNIAKSHRYTIYVRKDVRGMEDAHAAAAGLRQGLQQILNLETTDATLRQRVWDYMTCACQMVDGDVEKISEYVWMVVPNSVEVIVEPVTPKMTSMRN